MQVLGLDRRDAALMVLVAPQLAAVGEVSLESKLRALRAGIGADQGQVCLVLALSNSPSLDCSQMVLQTWPLSC